MKRKLLNLCCLLVLFLLSACSDSDGNGNLMNMGAVYDISNMSEEEVEKVLEGYWKITEHIEGEESFGNNSEWGWTWKRNTTSTLYMEFHNGNSKLLYYDVEGIEGEPGKEVNVTKGGGQIGDVITTDFYASYFGSLPKDIGYYYGPGLGNNVSNSYCFYCFEVSSTMRTEPVKLKFLSDNYFLSSGEKGVTSGGDVTAYSFSITGYRIELKDIPGEEENPIIYPVAP